MNALPLFALVAVGFLIGLAARPTPPRPIPARVVNRLDRYFRRSAN